MIIVIAVLLVAVGGNRLGRVRLHMREIVFVSFSSYGVIIFVFKHLLLLHEGEEEGKVCVEKEGRKIVCEPNMIKCEKKKEYFNIYIILVILFFIS